MDGGINISSIFVFDRIEGAKDDQEDYHLNLSWSYSDMPPTESPIPLFLHIPCKLLSAPTSLFRTSTYFSTERSHCRCLLPLQWPGSGILPAATFLLSLGSCPYSSLLVMWKFWSTFKQFVGGCQGSAFAAVQEDGLHSGVN